MKAHQKSRTRKAFRGHVNRVRLDIDAVRQAYRRYAGSYDFYFGPVMQKGRRAAVKLMNCQPGEKILEVGVGTGLSLDLYPRFVEVTGVDISREMLSKARARKERLGLDHVVELLEMDAERMQFCDHSFDKVAAIYVASVVPQPIRLVNEMRRVCKPGGELFFLNHFRSKNPVIGGIERLLAPLSRLLGFHPDLSLQSFIEETKLEVIDQNQANVFGYWMLIRARNNADDLGVPAQIEERTIEVPGVDLVTCQESARVHYAPRANR